MVYYGGIVKDSSKSKSKKPAFKTQNHRPTPSVKVEPVSPPPRPLHLLTIPELVRHFRANAGQLVLIVERESRVNGGEYHFIATRFVVGLLGGNPRSLLGAHEFVPTSAYVPLDEEVPMRREGIYVLKRSLDRIGNSVHVGPMSKKMLEVVVGTEAVLAYDAAELSHREWRSRTAVAKRLLGKEEKRSRL